LYPRFSSTFFHEYDFLEETDGEFQMPQHSQDVAIYKPDIKNRWEHLAEFKGRSSADSKTAESNYKVYRNPIPSIGIAGLERCR